MAHPAQADISIPEGRRLLPAAEVVVLAEAAAARAARLGKSIDEMEAGITARGAET